MKKYILPIVLFLIILFLILYLKSKVYLPNVEETKKYAAMLIDKGLYHQAILEYQRLIEHRKLSKQEIANLSYIIGNIYMDNIHDYENALASYLKVKLLKASNEIMQDIEKRIIECLERSGRILDAQMEMEKATALKPSREIPKGTVVAKIRNREITMEELLSRINELPAYLQNYYKDKSKQLEYLKQYIAIEILYDAAKRRNFDSDKEILKKTEEARKSFMVEKLIEEEIKPKIKVSESEMKNYYEAHKKDFVDDKKKQKKFEDVKEQIKARLEFEKQQELTQEFISKQLEVQKVIIYEDLFK
jgi:tetratricopeptide (TPR) repeat protein